MQGAPYGALPQPGVFRTSAPGYALRSAEVAELVDAHDSKSCSARNVGSIPTFGTIATLPAMPNPVLIIVNESHEGPGLLGHILTENGIPSEVIDLNAGDVIPDVRDYSALIIMGGTDSANDETAKMKNELEKVQEAMDARLPCFGVCLGLQVLVKAAGGTVVKNDVREVGFRDPSGEPFCVDVTEEGKKDPLMAGLPDVLPMFHLHGETVELTKKMALLASGEWCVNQIVRIAPTVYGMQGHLELTDEMFRVWCEENAWLKECHKALLEDHWAERKEEMESTIRTLFGNFLGIAGLL